MQLHTCSQAHTCDMTQAAAVRLSAHIAVRAEMIKQIAPLWTAGLIELS